MDYIEVSGKNVDEALTNALIKLETTSDKVEYEVIEKGSAGFLGMGRKLAVIKVRKKEDKPVEANVKAKETETQKVADSSVSYEPVKAEPVKSVDNNEIKDDSHEQPKKTSKYTTVMPNEEVERRITTFLGDMFKAMNLEVKIDVKFDDTDCVNVELSGPNMGVLIGKRGQTLDSIQYLTSLVVNKGKDKYVRIKVDTEDYRNRRKETLESLAKNIAYKVKRSRKPVSLEPMNPYERRIIHSTLQNDKAEILASFDDRDDKFYYDRQLHQDLRDNTWMFADTAKINMNVEYNKTEANGLQTQNYKIKNMDFGLEKRPETKIELSKEITDIKITLASGDTTNISLPDGSATISAFNNNGFLPHLRLRISYCFCAYDGE